MKYLFVLLLLFFGFAAYPQAQELKFRKVTGFVTNSNNKPVAWCGLYLYGTIMGVSADSAGKFDFVFPNDRTVFIGISENDKEYLIKVQPQDKTLNIKLNAATLARSIDNLAEFNKNDSTTNLLSVYSTYDYYRFLGRRIRSADDDVAELPKGSFPGEIKDLNPVYQPSKVDVPAQLKNGPGDWEQYLATNLKYPETAKLKGINGTVLIGVIIEKDGSLSDIKVVRGINDDCDNEALRLVRLSPKWTPAKANHGKKVRANYPIVVTFKLK